MKVKLGRRPKDQVPDEKPPPSTGPGLSAMLRGASAMDYLFLFSGILLSILTGALLPFNSLIFQGMTNVLSVGQANYTAGTLDMHEFASGVLHYCLLYLILGCVIFLVGYSANASLYTMCERRIHAVRKAYLRAVMRQDMTWLDSQQTGALTQKMSSGMEKIKDGMGDKLGLLFGALGTTVSGIAVGFYMCWQMTLVLLITVPLLGGTMIVSGVILGRASKSEMSAYADAGALALEVISGIRTVISFNSQPFEISRYEHQLKIARKLGIRKAYVLAMFAAVPLFLMFLAMAGGFYYGAYLVYHNVVSPGTVFGVFWAVLVAALRFGAAAPQIGIIMSARMAARDIFDIIDRKPLIDCDSDDGLTPSEVGGHIVFSNIEFAYPSRPSVKILKGIDLEVKQGQSVALVGASGCGKSTILGLLQRFYDQDAGTILFDDIPLRDINIRWLRDCLGVVQQDPVIFAATVAENIRLGDVTMTDQDVIEACQQANAYDFVMKLSEGFETRIGESAVQLSGGQKQRIAIARALARKPKILLLDEATSALDTESEQIVQEALDRAREGRTTICVAHRLSTVRNADKIVVFDQGHIVEEGTHDELMEIEDGLYVHLVKMQEITKGNDDTTLDEVEPTTLIRGYSKSGEDIEEERRSKKEISVQTERIRLSMISTTTQEPEWQLDDAREEMIEEGAMEASLMDIFRYSKPELPMAVTGLIMALLRGLTWPVFSIIYGQLFLVLTSPDDTSSGISTSLWFILLAVCSGITTFLSGTFFGISGERMAMRLRLDVYKNVLRHDVSYFDDPKHSVGNLTSRLASDAPNVQAAIDQRLSEVLQGVSSLISGMIVAFIYGWNMAPIGLVTSMMLVAAQSAVTQYLKRRGQKDLDVAVEASRIVTETMINLKCIQSLNRQQYMYDSYGKAALEPHRRAVSRGLWQSLNFALGSSFILWNFAIAYSFGLWLVSNHWSTPFVIFQVIEALNMASVSVLAAASYFPEYIRARISAGVLFSMIRQQPKIDNMSHAGERPEIKGNISLKNVYFSYPTNSRSLILNGLDINAKFGQTVALVGPSGSGKSTVIQMLERYYDPLCGVVSVDNYDIRDLSIRHLRDQMALVGQEPILFNVSIRDNIAYGLDSCSQEEIEKAAQLANIHQFITSLPEGYNTLVGARGGRLSGGQKQRISIARAIVRNPKILLLDEATSALDSESEKIVQEALDRARLGRTCFVIAHRLSTIQNADLIIVCRDGKVVEKGTHQTLLARKGVYYKLVERQH